MDTLLRDVRHAARSLARSPGFSTVALLTLALGIGANTAIFSIVNAVILQPLGYPKPEQLMYFTTQSPGFPEFWVSPPEYLEFRELNQSFSAVGAYTTGEVNLTASDRPRRVRSAAVDDHLLRALGVQAAQGRLFTQGETDVTGPPPVPGQPQLPPPPIAILSHEIWRTAFEGRPIVGQTVEVNGVRREVIGIMPPGVDVADNRTQIWLPLGLNPANRSNRASHTLYLIGRLKDSSSTQSAQTELHTLIDNWGARVGVVPESSPAGHVFTPLSGSTGGHILQMKPLQEELVRAATRPIWVLQASVGLVLLLACANLANLLLARAETRRREFAIRTALGATGGQLLRQFITEGVMLSMAGGTLGLWLAHLGVHALLRVYPTSLPRTSEVTVDLTVLLFTVGVATATGVLFGLAPIVHTRVSALAATLKDSGGKGATGSVRRRIRGGLVVTQVALAVLLIIGAGLLIRTVYNLGNVDTGFDRGRLITFSTTLPAIKYRQPSVRAGIYQRLLVTLRGVPGVQLATAMSGLPPNRLRNSEDLDIDNYTAPPEGPFENVDYYQIVMSDYFETIGVPIVSGRGFRSIDVASSGIVAIVNESFANTFWNGRDPIGQRVRICCGDQVPWFTVIGVAKDVKQGGVDQKTGTELYLFVEQTARVPPPAGIMPGTMNVVLRTTLPPAALAQTIESVVREVDPTVPVTRLRGMEEVFLESIQRPRLLAQLLGALAGLALLIAAIGTYGVLSYSVAERHREIGIRIAIGASRVSVVAQIMKQGLLLTLMGTVTGLAVALSIGQLIRSLLFGVQPTDPATLAGVIATITLVAAAACGLPAWRAARINPLDALRTE